MIFTGLNQGIPCNEMTFTGANQDDDGNGDNDGDREYMC
jgi:hypothetical protein